MADMLGWQAGVVESKERQHRGRMDLMRGFEEFKRNNPYATAADYQAFIDQAAGMDNYLRGGMPGREVLSRLEAQNMERKRRDTTQAKLAEVAQRAQTMGQLEAMAHHFILSTGDAAEAERAMIDAVGGPQNLAGIPIGSLFSPQSVERVHAAKSVELLPVVLDMLKATGGNAKATEIAQRLGVNPVIAEAAREQAMRQFEQERQSNFVRNFDNLLQMGIRGAESGMDVSDVIRQMPGTESFTEDQRRQLADAVEKGYTERRVRSSQERRAQFLAAFGEEMTARVQDFPGDEIREEMQDLATTLGIELSDEDVDALHNHFTRRSDTMRMQQHRQRKEMAPAEMASRVDELRGRSLQVANEYMDNNGVPAQGPLRGALRILANEYNMTDTSKLQTVVAEFARSGQSSNEIAEQIRQRGMLTPFNEMQQELLDHWNTVNPPLMRLNDWVRTGIDASRPLVDNVRREAVEPYKNADPEQQVRAYQATRDAITRDFQDAMHTVREAGENHKSWLLSSDQWNPRAVQAVIQNLEQQLNQILMEIDTAHQRAQQVVAQSEQEAAAMPAPQRQPFFDPTPGSGGLGQLEGVIPRLLQGAPQIQRGQGEAPPPPPGGARPEELPQYPQRERSWPQ